MQILHKNLKNFTLTLDKSKRRIFSVPSKTGDITIVELLDTDSINCFLEMDLDYLNGLEDLFIMDIGLNIKWKVLVCLFGLIIKNLLEI